MIRGRDADPDDEVEAAGGSGEVQGADRSPFCLKRSHDPDPVEDIPKRVGIGSPFYVTCSVECSSVWRIQEFRLEPDFFAAT